MVDVTDLGAPRVGPSDIDRDLLSPNLSPDAFGAAIGRGLQNLAVGVSALGTAADRRQKQTDRFNAATGLTDFQLNISNRLEEMKREVDPATANFYEMAEAETQNLLNDYMKGVPPEVQDEYLARASNIRAGQLRQAFQFELTQKDTWWNEGIAKELNAAKTAVSNDPSPVNLAASIERMGKVLSETGLSEIEKAQKLNAITWDLKAQTLQKRVVDEKLNLASDGSGAGIIMHHEGFRAQAYMDKKTSGGNAGYRVGFGHDVVVRTMPNGEQVVEKVTKDTVVTSEEAYNTLMWLIQNREGKKAREQVPGFGNLAPNVQWALYSVAYNYGRLPSSVAKAANTGNVDAIANAVEGLSANKGRRRQEAAVIRGGSMATYSAEFDDLPYDLRTKALADAEQEWRTKVAGQTEAIQAQAIDSASLNFDNQLALRNAAMMAQNAAMGQAGMMGATADEVVEVGEIARSEVFMSAMKAALAEGNLDAANAVFYDNRGDINGRTQVEARNLLKAKNDEQLALDTFRDIEARGAGDTTRMRELAEGIDDATLFRNVSAYIDADRRRAREDASASAAAAKAQMEADGHRLSQVYFGLYDGGHLTQQQILAQIREVHEGELQSIILSNITTMFEQEKKAVAASVDQNVADAMSDIQAQHPGDLVAQLKATEGIDDPTLRQQVRDQLIAEEELRRRAEGFTEEEEAEEAYRQLLEDNPEATPAELRAIVRRTFGPAQNEIQQLVVDRIDKRAREDRESKKLLNEAATTKILTGIRDARAVNELWDELSSQEKASFSGSDYRDLLQAAQMAREGRAFGEGDPGLLADLRSMQEAELAITDIEAFRYRLNEDEFAEAQRLLNAAKAGQQALIENRGVFNQGHELIDRFAPRSSGRKATHLTSNDERQEAKNDMTVWIQEYMDANDNRPPTFEELEAQARLLMTRVTIGLRVPGLGIGITGFTDRTIIAMLDRVPPDQLAGARIRFEDLRTQDIEAARNLITEANKLGINADNQLDVEDEDFIADVATMMLLGNKARLRQLLGGE